MKFDTLSSVAQIIMGQSPPSSSYNSRGQGLPFFQGKTDFGDLYPKARIFCTEPLKIAEAGDILISVRAPVGPTNLNREKSCIGRGLAALRCKEGYDIKYLFYFMRFYEPKWTQVSTGSTFDAISRDDIESIDMPILSLSEQKRVATILEKADRLRRQRRYALELSDTYVQTVFLEMFGDPTMNQRHWELNLLSKEGVLDRGKSQHRPRDAAHLYGGPYPFIQTGDVANSNGLITQYSQTYSEAGLAQSRLWKKGTLCITIAANIAKTAILDFDACFPDSIVGFIPGPRVTVEYVRQWFVKIQNRLEKAAPQSAQKNINLEILRNLQISVPPSTLQKKFAQIVQKHERFQVQQREALWQAEHLFQTLLHRAFQGELELGKRAEDMPEEQARYVNATDLQYALTAPTKLVAEEMAQLVLPME